MIGIIIALVAALGASGTVAVADTARPGDALYSIDQAVERARLALTTNNTQKDNLRIRFAEERIKEVEELVKEKKAPADVLKAIADGTVTKIEAELFTNETIIKIETEGAKEVFATAAKTREEIVRAILARHSTLTRGFVEKTLRIEKEDRASRSEDKMIRGRIDSLSEADRANATLGMESALNLLAEVATKDDAGDTRMQAVADALNAYMNTLPDGTSVQLSGDKLRLKLDDGAQKIDVKIRENGTSKIESRTQDGRIRVEIKNGVVEVKSREANTTPSSKTRSGLTEAEAEVSETKTMVELEYNDEKTIFSTTATTREGIIDAIIERIPTLTRANVDAVLKLEVEDVRDALDPVDDNNSSSDDDNDSGKDDSDNSGSGKNR